MKTHQIIIQSSEISSNHIDSIKNIKPQLILVFADITYFNNPQFLTPLKANFHQCHIIGCSTAGEIYQQGVLNKSVIITAISFDNPDFVVASTILTTMSDSESAGHHLASQLTHPQLKHVFILGQGVNINGSALIKGLKDQLPNHVTMSGGLAGDDGQFTKTFVINGDFCSEQQIVALGFYGTHINITSSFASGWNSFGTTCQITKSKNNILYELDGKPALEIYKNYLGQYAQQLPASGLLFPLAMLTSEGKESGVIRTILDIHEEDNSLILAGDIIENGYVRLMHSSTESLVNSATQAAQKIKAYNQHTTPSLAILVSCVGRKLLMANRSSEEIRTIHHIFDQHTTLAGFYSNGEIGASSINNHDSKLHNQTMTITYLSES